MRRANSSASGSAYGRRSPGARPDVAPQPTLRTERLLLRAFRPEDAAVVQRLAGEREVADTTLTIPHPYRDGMAETWIATHAEAWERQERLTLAITAEALGVIGAISLHLRPVHRRAELGYWVGRPFWNCGYATEAARAVIAFGFEALGLSLPYSSTMAAEDEEKARSAAESAEAVVHAIHRQLLPRTIMSRQAFENAIAVVAATGGSTNAVLHLLAIAKEAGVDLALPDFGDSMHASN